MKAGCEGSEQRVCIRECTCSVSPASMISLMWLAECHGSSDCATVVPTATAAAAVPYQPAAAQAGGVMLL